MKRKLHIGIYRLIHMLFSFLFSQFILLTLLFKCRQDRTSEVFRGRIHLRRFICERDCVRVKITEQLTRLNVFNIFIRIKIIKKKNKFSTINTNRVETYSIIFVDTNDIIVCKSTKFHDSFLSVVMDHKRLFYSKNLIQFLLK